MVLLLSLFVSSCTSLTIIGPNLAQEIEPPPSLYKGYPADPTPGVPPTFPSRFHLSVLHIILGERLVNIESHYSAFYP